MKKRQQHMKKVLSTLNSDCLPASTMDGDVDMEDVSSSGFKRAGGGCNDFSFMKRKVRVNAVDKDIMEY